MPCYNEEESIGYTIPHLVQAFEARGHRLQLVAVDNGSTDSTGRILKELQRQFPAIQPHRVDVNQGYGWGVLCGLPLCTAPWVGIIPADGQVDAEDVVRLFEAVKPTRGKVLGKVRRRFRMDGLQRKAISTAYNLFVRVVRRKETQVDLFISRILEAVIVKRTTAQRSPAAPRPARTGAPAWPGSTS